MPKPLAGLTRQNFAREAVAGATLRAIAIPLSIGHAQTAGLPPTAGRPRGGACRAAGPRWGRPRLSARRRSWLTGRPAQGEQAALPTWKSAIDTVTAGQRFSGVVLIGKGIASF